MNNPPSQDTTACNTDKTLMYVIDIVYYNSLYQFAKLCAVNFLLVHGCKNNATIYRDFDYMGDKAPKSTSRIYCN